jgi:glycosyltransferase involved in cell wall biosynthesis
MRVLCWISDLSGCYTYRVRIPFSALNRYGVTMAPIPELPSNPFGNAFQELVDLIAQYDLVIVQRCYKYDIVKPIKDACDLLRKKLIFETDDDYLHLPPTNPCYEDLSGPGIKENYKKILGMVDMVTVSTKELGDTIYPYNKNIHILPNNVQSVLCGDYGTPKRGYLKEESDNEGRVQILNKFGMVGVPAYWDENEKTRHRTIRIGYTGTPTHREDFMTIAHTFDKLIDKYKGKIWIVYVGDDWFYRQTLKGRGRIVHVPTTESYEKYIYHIRNIDIGIAPLVPNIFNMSKSPIKAIEYGMWGIPAVLPNYVTYNREFVHEKNCMLYNNSREFSDALEELINNDELRFKLGLAARDHVRDNRLEHLHAEKRYKIYKELLDSNKKLIKLSPNKVKEEISV